MNIYPKYMLFTLFCIFLIFILITNSCDSTEPEKIKSPRDYNWSSDTVYNPKNFQTLMSSIWGTSESNIYMCGHSSGAPGSLWHFNGIEWKVIDLFTEIGHSARLISVHGTSNDNIWVVGNNKSADGSYTPYIISFNGVNWTKHSVNFNSAIHSVFVNRINDVWLCGSDGIVLHFDEIHLDWRADTLKVERSRESRYNLFSITDNNQGTYVYGNVVEDNGLETTYYIFQKKSIKWEKINSFKTNNINNKLEWGITKLYSSRSEKLYSLGGGLWQNTNNGWEIRFTENLELKGIYDTGDNNMIIAGSYGKVYHYNGNNWKALEIPNIENVHYQAVWMTDDSAFLIGWDLEGNNAKTIVTFGK